MIPNIHPLTASMRIGSAPGVFLVFALSMIAVLSGPLSGSAAKSPARAEAGDASFLWAWRVRDPETGKALAGAAIEVVIRKTQQTGKSPDRVGVLSDRSGGEGRFIVAFPAHLRWFKVLAVDVSGALEGHAAHTSSVLLDFRPVKESTLWLPAATTLSGRVDNPDGKPAAGQRVHVHVHTLPMEPGRDVEAPVVSFVTSVLTGADGRFALGVPARGECTLSLWPAQAVPLNLPLHQARGDVGVMRLGSGISIRGRVVDAGDNPQREVRVELIGLANQIYRMALTDAAGHFRMPPVPPGDYTLTPVPDIPLTDDIRNGPLPAQLRRSSAEIGLVHVQRLRATFVQQQLTVQAAEPAPEIELKAVPHATLLAHFVDGAGRPTDAVTEAYEIQGTCQGRPWAGSFEAVAGQADAMSAMVPVGLEDVVVLSAEPCRGWGWAWDAKTPPQDGQEIRLKRIDGDRPAMVVTRFKGATLEIHVHAKRGKLPDDLFVGVSHNTLIGPQHDRTAERVAPGKFRVDEGVFPFRSTFVVVEGQGFKTVITEPFQFTEDRQTGVIELTLEPGDHNEETKVPVILKMPDGRPIAQPREVSGAVR